MGNCVRQGSVKVDSIEKRKSKNPNRIKKLLEEADKQEQEDAQGRKRINKKTPQNGSEDEGMNKQLEETGLLTKKKSNNIDTSIVGIKKMKTPLETPEKSTIDKKKKGSSQKSFIEDSIQKKEQNVPTHMLVQIEEQRHKCETTVKQQINDLNLEKNVISSVFQLLRDYLSHIKDTKKYWVKIKLIGFSKGEYNLNQVGGSISIVVEYNTGEMVKLRIIFSKEMEKSNFDLDTFVFYSKLENQNLVEIQDFNFRISPKYMRYYIFSESHYHETSVQQMIIHQANTEKPQMTASSFRQMFTDLLNLLNYLSEVKFTHGGIHPSNIYVKKCMEKDGRYVQKVLVDLSLQSNTFNRRNTKFKEYAFRKSSDLQMFAISMLSLMSSIDINSIQETTKKSIISSKLSAPSIIQVDNDIRYMIHCILKGSDMILEFGASEIKSHFDNQISYENHLALSRSNQQKNQISFCYLINNGCEIIVYSFYTKWSFGYRVYDSIKQDNKVNIKHSYCSSDYLYIIFEIHDSSDLFISRINLRKKCLDNKSLNIIKQISDTLFKMQSIKNERELDTMKAFETIDSKNEGLISSDDFLQFAYDNKIKDIQNNQIQDFTTIISYFDEQDIGKLNFYEFRNMLQYIMSSRPFIVFEVTELIELPRHYQPATMMKKGNDLYLLGGTYLSLPSNKCYRYFLKNIKENQEIQKLDCLSQNGISIDTSDSKKIITWTWNEKNDFFNHNGEQDGQQLVKLNVNQILQNENAIDAHEKKNSNILQFDNTQEMKIAMMSQKSMVGLKDIVSTKSLGSQLKIVRTASIPINITVEQERNDDKNQKGIIMNVFNIDKNIWSSCSIQENKIFKKQNFFLPLNESGQVIIFDKDDFQNAWLVGITLDHIEIHYLQLYFQDRSAVKAMINGIIQKKINVAFYENSLLFLRKSKLTNQFYYCVFIINEETGVVSYNEYELISYLGEYERVSKIPIRYLESKKYSNNNSFFSSQLSQMSSLNGGVKSGIVSSSSGMNQKIKINRYSVDRVLAQFGDTVIYQAHRSSLPNIDFKIFTRSINNQTEKIDDVYEILKFLSVNSLQGRIPPIKDVFYIFDSNSSSIKLNIIYSNEDIGQSMAEVIASLQKSKHQTKYSLLQSINQSQNINSKKKGNNKKHKKNQNSKLKQKQDKIDIPAKESRPKKITKIRSASSMKSGSNIGDALKGKRKKVFPARLQDLVCNLKNVLICLHYMQQNRFFLKEVSPHTLLSVKDGKYFSPINFYHENTFTTLNSDMKEAIIRNHSIYQDYLSPQLLKAHEDGLCLNDISYNIHKSNIYSIGLVFLKYASLKNIRGFNRMDSASQIKLQIAINTLPYPKYVQDLFTHMLKVNEEDRLNASQLLDHLHQILSENKLDIYFPQVQSYYNGCNLSQSQADDKPSNPQSQSSPSSSKMDFYYTHDNPNCTLYLGGKSLLLEFKKTFKVDNQVTLEMNSIIGITKYSQGFYSIVKYPSQPTENMPFSIYKYLFIKLVGLPVNPKVLQGTLISALPQFTGRDITSLNIANIDQFSVIIYGGEENSSIGLIEIKETYLIKDTTNGEDENYTLKKHIFSGDEETTNEESEKEQQSKITRLDDLKNSVGRAQLFSYNIASDYHRWFDYESISEDDQEQYNDDDDNNGTHGNIPERSELDEDDMAYNKGINATSDQESEEDEEEEEQKEQEEEEEKKESGIKQQTKKEVIQERMTEHYVIDQRIIQKSSCKQQISVQIIKTDYSIQQRYISLKNKTINTASNQNTAFLKKEKQHLITSEGNTEVETLQFIPLSDSLIIGLDVEYSNAYLISLITLKSINLPIINDVPFNQFIQLKQIKKLAQKFYQVISQKTFIFIYQKENDLMCHQYDLDIDKFNLRLSSQMIILPNYGFTSSKPQEIPSKTMADEDLVQNNKIILPQLTLKIKTSNDDGTPFSQQNNFITKQGGNVTPNNLNNEDKIPTPSTIKSMNSQIEQILEENEEDDPFYSASDYKKKPSFQTQKFTTQKSKLGLIKQKDTIVDSSINQQNCFENDQNKIEENDYSSQYSEEEKQDFENQNTADLQIIIQNQINQNKKLLLEKSLEVSPSSSPLKVQSQLKFIAAIESSQNNNNNNNNNNINNNNNKNDQIENDRNTGKQLNPEYVDEQNNNIKQNNTFFNQEPITIIEGFDQNGISPQQSLQQLRQYLSDGGVVTNQNTQLSFNLNGQNLSLQNQTQGIYKYPTKDELQMSTMKSQQTGDNLKNITSQSTIEKRMNPAIHSATGIDIVQEESQDSHSITSKNNSQTVIGGTGNITQKTQSKQQQDQSNNGVQSSNQIQDLTHQQNENLLQMDDYNIHDNQLIFDHHYNSNQDFSNDEQFCNMLMVDYDL